MAGVVRNIRKALRRVNKEISGMSVGKYGCGLAGEGYAGGYRDALSDVLVALSGSPPNRRDYWEDFKSKFTESCS